MASPKCREEPVKPPRTIRLYDEQVKGITKLTVDSKATITLNVKTVEVGRDMYDKEKPLRTEVQVLSGKISSTKAAEDIKNSKNLKELDEVTKNVPREVG